MKRIMGAAVLAVVLAGCHTTGQKITKLDPGSTREQVVAALGRPDAMRTVGEFEVYTYLARKRTRLSVVHTDYTVILKDGQVVQYGPGLARREGVHSMVIEQPES
ncbi:outer membrane protein assembly factor BamE domain-containing protein [Dyella subtropica]|uniref:outer membrane protein assembly factor BamE domain-containing protein n=1 Tax=Dyella subtropica TaxID=2992127 RepID=UPI0022542231|nr:outer membrane protein assembly factor BamE [Dyella subtropica]